MSNYQFDASKGDNSVKLPQIAKKRSTMRAHDSHNLDIVGSSTDNTFVKVPHMRRSEVLGQPTKIRVSLKGAKDKQKSDRVRVERRSDGLGQILESQREEQQHEVKHTGESNNTVDQLLHNESGVGEPSQSPCQMLSP